MRLSIIIPAYNNEKDIARIFDGLLALDRSSSKRIIVADGSYGCDTEDRARLFRARHAPDSTGPVRGP